MRITTQGGHDLARVVSAMQKAIRRNDVRTAGYFAMELTSSGFGAYAWRRLLIISAEDCAALVTSEVKALYDAWDMIRKQMTDKARWNLAGRIFVAKAVILLCTAAKSRDADILANLVHEAKGISDAEVAAILKRTEPVPIPDYADDVHTMQGKRRGLTRRDFFLTEDAAITPRGRTLFDDDIERLRAGELDVADRNWKKGVRK